MLSYKLRAIRVLLGARSLALQTEQMTMCAVTAMPDQVMMIAQMEAQAHVLRGDLSKVQNELADSIRDEIRVRIIRSEEEK